MVPENIHTPTMEGIENSGGVGWGSKAQENPEEKRGRKRKGEGINYFPEGQLQLLLTEFVDFYWGSKLD